MTNGAYCRLKGGMWVIYMMSATCQKSGTNYFKIGVSENVPKRIANIQTSCPLFITHVWTIDAIFNGSAQSLERELHKRLEKYRIIGEWFWMDTEDPEHKKDMNAAMEYAREVCSQMGPEKWKLFEVAAMREEYCAQELAQRMEKSLRKKVRSAKRRWDEKEARRWKM